ncbi:hypothetical protein GQ42DRAFT_150853 [Ramicandelaber brevisporus]|nr:hypothetical protein GQ42DRAFT_150853 [Ramicandelaber brevisporus]
MTSPATQQQQQQQQQTQQQQAQPAKPSGGRVQPPNEQAHKKAVADLDAKIAALKKQQDDVQAKLAKTGLGPKGSKVVDPVEAKQKELIAQLDVIRQQQGDLKKDRSKTFDKMDELKALITKKSADLKTQSAKLPYKSEEEIDRKIAELNRRIETGNLKLVEEKRLDNEIGALARSKKLVSAYAKLKDEVDTLRAELANVQSTLDKGPAGELSSKYDALQAELDTVKASRQDVRAQRNELFNERNKVKEDMDAAYDAKRDLIAKHRAAMDSYYIAKRADEQRRREAQAAERRKQEIEERLEDLKEELADADVLPYQSEIKSCDILLLHFTGSADGSSPAVSASASSSAAATDVPNIRQIDAKDVLQSGTVLAKKSDRQEAFFVGKSKKGANKKDAANGSASPAASPSVTPSGSGSGSARFTIPLSIIERLSALKVTAPLSSADVEATVKTLRSRRNWFVNNQQRKHTENKAAAQAKYDKLTAELNVEFGLSPAASPSPAEPASEQSASEEASTA